MVRLCINCDTENPGDAVICSECGMSLRRAPTGEEALKLKAEVEPRTESPMRKVGDSADRAAGLTGPIPWAAAVVWAVGWMVPYIWLVAAYAAADDIAWEDLPILTGLWLLWCLAPTLVLWRQRSRTAERQRVMRDHYDAAKRYHQTGESLRGADLSRSDLTGIELSKADLRGANLMRADLSGANLEGANLSRANLEAANLQGASLKEATLDQAVMRRANLREAKLERAILWRAKLYGAQLGGANLQEADLLKAVLEGARLDDSTVMPEGWEEIVARKP